MLAQLTITNAKTKAKPCMLRDGEGLHLRVHTSGGKARRFRFAGKANMMSLDPFPAVAIAKPRTKRDEAKALIAAGINPALRKKLDKITTNSPNFRGITDEYLVNLKTERAADATLSTNTWMLTVLAAHSKPSHRPNHVGRDFGPPP